MWSYQPIGSTGSSACRIAAASPRSRARAAGSVVAASAASVRAIAGLDQPIAPQSPPPSPKSDSIVPIGSGTSEKFRASSPICSVPSRCPAGISLLLPTATVTAIPTWRSWSCSAAAITGSSGRSGKVRRVRRKRAPSRTSTPSCPGRQPSSARSARALAWSRTSGGREGTCHSASTGGKSCVAAASGLRRIARAIPARSIAAEMACRARTSASAGSAAFSFSVIVRGIGTAVTTIRGLRLRRSRLAGSSVKTRSACPLSASAARVSPRPTASRLARAIAGAAPAQVSARATSSRCGISTVTIRYGPDPITARTRPSPSSEAGARIWVELCARKAGRATNGR